MIEVADAALRYLYQPRSLDPAARLFFSVLIVTPACGENPIKKGNEGITFCYQGFPRTPPYSILRFHLRLLIFAHFSYIHKIILCILGSIKNYFILFCNFMYLFVFFRLFYVRIQPCLGGQFVLGRKFE